MGRIRFLFSKIIHTTQKKHTYTNSSVSNEQIGSKNKFKKMINMLEVFLDIITQEDAE